MNTDETGIWAATVCPGPTGAWATQKPVGPQARGAGAGAGAGAAVTAQGGPASFRSERQRSTKAEGCHHPHVTGQKLGLEMST